MRHSRRFTDDRDAVTAARRFATEALDGLGRDAVDSVELMVSELASNCVRHARSEFVISLELRGGTLHVVATDWGGGTPQMREPDPTEITGRGLMIIDMLSASWGVEQPIDGRGGKRVWFTLLAPEAAAGPEPEPKASGRRPSRG